MGVIYIGRKAGEIQGRWLLAMGMTLHTKQKEWGGMGKVPGFGGKAGRLPKGTTGPFRALKMLEQVLSSGIYSGREGEDGWVGHALFLRYLYMYPCPSC